MRLPAPASDLNGNGDDLLYRTTPSAGGPTPGTVHNVEREVRPDRQTGREPWLTYHAVFDPAVIPFKRNSAKDAVKPDGGLIVGVPSLYEVPVAGNRTQPGRQVFWGSILVELEPGMPIPIPSVAAESQVLSYETVPEVTLRFFKDGADNFYVQGAGHSGRVRVNFVMDAPSVWFRHTPAIDLLISDVPRDKRPLLPAVMQESVDAVARAIGVEHETRYAIVLQKLVFWFRDFAPGDLEGGKDNDYLDIALSRKGVCRHRGYAFVITAHGLGIPARYVSNEAHVFVEVYVPRAGWTRIDLGGGALGMNVRNSRMKTRHTVDEADPYGFPPGFRDGYSHRATADTPTTAGGDPVRGLPPTPSGQVGATGGAGTKPTGRPWGGGQSKWGVPRAVPFPVKASQIATRTTLAQVSARVFRGDKLSLRGTVSSDGKPIAGGRVRINLMDTNKSEILRVLGNARTDEDGIFVTAVSVPLDVELGTWEVVAEFAGNARYAPSHSE